MPWSEEDVQRLIRRGQVSLVEKNIRPRQQRTMVLTSETIVGDLSESSRTIDLRLPMSPSFNHYWRSIIAGSCTRLHTKVLISLEGRRYRLQAGMEIFRQWPQEIPRPLTGRLAIDITLVPAHQRSFDIDNRMKATMDVLQYAGVYINDSQIDDLHVHRSPPRKDGGYMLVRLGSVIPR